MAVTWKQIAYQDDLDSHASQHGVGSSDTIFPADPGVDKCLMWDNDPGELVWAVPAGSGGGDVVSIGSATASDSAALAFTGLAGAYSAFMVVIQDLVPATDGVNLRGRVSDDNGTSYESTNYHSIIEWQSTGDAARANLRYTNNDYLFLSYQTGNGATEGYSGTFWLYHPAATTTYKRTVSKGVHDHYTKGVSLNEQVGAWKGGTGAITALQFSFHTGNITSGSIEVYGIVAN